MVSGELVLCTQVALLAYNPRRYELSTDFAS